MFKRREKPKLSFRIKQLIWPQMEFRRLMHYYRLRIIRLSHAPEPLARAIACGITVSFFPIFGTHALLAAAIAVVIRANIVAAAAATMIVPPVILPLIFSLDFVVGRKILRYFGFYGQSSEAEYMRNALQGSGYFVSHFDYLMDHFYDYFLPAFVGSTLFMLMAWPATYMAAHKLIEGLVHHHRIRKAARMARRQSKAGA
jgi:uncharacterized protein (DUF2062 family)